MSWEDARVHCITIEGHLVQFEDIPQQTEVQKSLFSNMNDDVWIGLKANVRQHHFIIAMCIITMIREQCMLYYLQRLAHQCLRYLDGKNIYKKYLENMI